MALTFNDVKFIKHPIGSSWAGNYQFENGHRLSVVAGPSMYCEPKLSLPNPADYKTFEVAVLDSNGDWATKTFVPDIEDDVIGWVTREQITELMAKIETFKVEETTTNK